MSIFYFLSLKCLILFKNLLLNLPFFIFCKKKFFENLDVLTDTVADLVVRYTLCAQCTSVDKEKHVESYGCISYRCIVSKRYSPVVVPTTEYIFS